MTLAQDASSSSGNPAYDPDRPPLTGLHVAAILICAAGLFADIAEVAVGNVFSAVFMAPPYSVARPDLSLLLASMFAGGAAGGPIFGWLADRHGRRTMLAAALCLIGAASFAAAASGGIAALTAFRFLAGLAIGAFPPLTTAYLSELLPARYRGPLLMTCGGLAYLGAPAVILLVRILAPATFGIEAWRLVLAMGGVLAAVTAGLFALLPESPDWLAAVRRGQAARGRPADGVMPAPRDALRLILGDAIHLRRLILLLALYLLVPWATLGFPLLSAAAMVSRGFSIGDSILFAGLSMFGPAIGLLSTACVVDRLDRRLAVSLCAFAMAGLGTAFAFAGTLSVLVLIGIAFNLASAIYIGILSIYAAEMFPTAMRASATAGAWGAGRLVSIVVPPVLLFVLTGFGQGAMCAVIVAAAAISLVLILAAGPPGRPGGR